MSDINITVLRNALTPKQLKFADEYIKSGNGTDAAIRAGYSKRTAKSIGSENLDKEPIKKYIQAVMADMSDEKIASAEDVMKFLSRVLYGQEQDTIGTGGEVFSVDASIKDRLKAAELIGKKYAMFTDKKETTVSGSIELQNLNKLPADKLEALADAKQKKKFDYKQTDD
ncbi:terminase small subunit [Apilactobacillus xinyiensis]|uniref:terminase small subunit n=1 Tax=Apilactobacillus xinyiensis TaxID=2841032 RepID=UPI001C7CA616|nr:terminase small subunit [Apilactobacillus xinyiensis]